MVLHVPDIIEFVSLRPSIEGFSKSKPPDVVFGEINFTDSENDSQNILGVFSKKRSPGLATYHKFLSGHGIPIPNKQSSADNESNHCGEDHCFDQFRFFAENSLQSISRFKFFEKKLYSPPSSIQRSNLLCWKLCCVEISNIKMVFPGVVIEHTDEADFNSRFTGLSCITPSSLISVVITIGV